VPADRENISEVAPSTAPRPAENEATDFPTDLLTAQAGPQALAQFWEAVQESIRERLGHERYSIWFRQTEPMAGGPGELVVGVPNVIIQQYLALRYTDAVESAVAELTGRPVRVRFDVAPRLFREMRARREQEERGESAPPAVAPAVSGRGQVPEPPAHWGFENLIVTVSNRLPYAAAREVAGQSNPRFSFLYVCGDYGLGKTALLRAIYALAAGPERGLNPIFTSTENWCNDYYHAIQQKRTRLFRSRYRSCRMLILDDLQFIEGKAGGQAELLHTAKHILSQGGRVVLAGKPHVEALRELDPAFHALLRRAFPAVILPPDAQERQSIVAQMARRRGLKTTDEVCRLIAEQFGDSFGRIESAISCLSLYAGVEGCERLTLVTARAALAAMQPPRTEGVVHLEQIREAVLQVFGVDAGELMGGSRRRSVCQARHVGMYLARKLTGSSLTEVGRFFGGASHSTVKHAVDKIEQALPADQRLAALVEQAKAQAGAA